MQNDLYPLHFHSSDPRTSPYGGKNQCFKPKCRNLNKKEGKRYWVFRNFSTFSSPVAKPVVLLLVSSLVWQIHNAHSGSKCLGFQVQRHKSQLFWGTQCSLTPSTTNRVKFKSKRLQRWVSLCNITKPQCPNALLNIHFRHTLSSGKYVLPLTGNA